MIFYREVKLADSLEVSLYKYNWSAICPFSKITKSAQTLHPNRRKGEFPGENPNRINGLAGTEFRVLVTAELLMSYTEKERVRESRTFLLLLGYSFALLEAALKGGLILKTFVWHIPCCAKLLYSSTPNPKLNILMLLNSALPQKIVHNTHRIIDDRMEK